MTAVGRGRELEANITTFAYLAPAPLVERPSLHPGKWIGRRQTRRQIYQSFVQNVNRRGRHDFNYGFHTGGHSAQRIKNLPFRRTYDILMNYFDFSGAQLIVVPMSRDMAYLSARAFVHTALQRHFITQYEEHKRGNWETLNANHNLQSCADYGPDIDLETVLSMVDMSTRIRISESLEVFTDHTTPPRMDVTRVPLPRLARGSVERCRGLWRVL